MEVQPHPFISSYLILRVDSIDEHKALSKSAWGIVDQRGRFIDLVLADNISDGIGEVDYPQTMPISHEQARDLGVSVLKLVQD